MYNMKHHLRNMYTVERAYVLIVGDNEHASCYDHDLSRTTTTTTMNDDDDDDDIADDDNDFLENTAKDAMRYCF